MKKILLVATILFLISCTNLKSIKSVIMIDNKRNEWNRGKQFAIDKKNGTVCKVAVDELSNNKRESGYVINGKNPQDILLYLNPRIRVSEGDTLIVFREDDNLLGRLKIDKKGLFYKASLNESFHDEVKLESFDKVLIEEREGENK